MYAVAVLIERQLTEIDAEQLTALHEGLDEPVIYHILMPVDNANEKIASSLGALGGQDLIPMLSTEAGELDELQHTIDSEAQRELDASVALLNAVDQRATGRLTHADPIDALASLIQQTKGAEVIILTAPHLVSEFFHLDWTSRARRHLDVPALHLLAHETFDEQASGAGEGNTGF